MSTTSSRDQVERCLKTLAAAYPDGTIATEQALAGMVARYAPDLEPFHPAAVDRGCREAARKCLAFPTLARLLPFVQDAAGKVADTLAVRAIPPPSGPDLWDADYRVLGVGLQIARGKCLTGRQTSDARSLFADLLASLGGLGNAKPRAEEAYRKDGEAGVQRLLEPVLAPRLGSRSEERSAA